MTPLPVLICALTVAASAPVQKLAMPRLTALNLDDKTASFYAEHLAQQLSQRGLSVVTAKDLETLLGIERQKELLGCAADSSSCSAELANALGVDGVVVADLAKLGTTYQLNVKVLSAIDGRRLASSSARVGSEEMLLPQLDATAKEIAQQLGGRGQEGSLLKPVAWGTVGLGAVLAATGTALLFNAKARHDALTSPTESPTDAPTASRLASEGQTFQTFGIAGVAVGVAAVAGGTAALLLSGSKAQVAFVPQPGGMAVGIAGAFP